MELAVDRAAAGYGGRPPADLLAEVTGRREAVAALLGHAQPDALARRLRRAAGWADALLGNLAFHLADRPAARARLDAAHRSGAEVGDRHLTAWARGAQAMVALYDGQPDAAAALAADGVADAPTPMARAQLLAWGLARALAATGNRAGALRALADAETAFAADPGAAGTSRFDFGEARLELSAADTLLALGDLPGAGRRAERSITLRREGTAGWAASVLVLAGADARSGDPTQAAARTLLVLDRLDPAGLRDTTRARLRGVRRVLEGAAGHPAMAELDERLRALR